MEYWMHRRTQDVTMEGIHRGCGSGIFLKGTEPGVKRNMGTENPE